MKVTHPWTYGATLGVASTLYFGPGQAVGAGSTTEGQAFAVIPAACTVRNLRVIYGAGGPGAGKSITFALRKYNSGSWSDALSVSLADTAVAVDSGANTATFAAGDCIALSTTPVSTPTGRACSVSIEIEADDATYQILLGCVGGVVRASDAATNYYNVLGLSALNTVETGGQLVMPAAGALSRLYVAPDQSIGGGAKSYTTTARVNAADQTAVQVVSVTTTALAAESDTTGSVSVARGDKVAWSNVPAATPTKVRFGWGCVFVPTTAGDAIYMAMIDPSAASARYHHAIRGSVRDTTEGNVKSPICSTAKMRDLYAIASVTPSPGTYTTPLRLNGASSALTVTVSSAAAFEDTTDEVDVVAGDTVDWLATPASSPVTVNVYVSCVFRVAAGGGGGPGRILKGGLIRGGLLRGGRLVG